MGLDMYLDRQVYIGAEFDFNKVTGIIDIKKGENQTPIPINFNKVKYITEEVMYWRKANHIHHWFVEHVQDGIDDCKRYYVSREELNELVKTCKKVLRNHALADELLPTSSGFFFGGTEYDEYYFDALKDTIRNIEPLVKDKNLRGDFYYQASW